MLEDMLSRAVGRGLDEARIPALRIALGCQLRLHLTQKFTEGIGRISPDVKHLRNTLVTIIRAYDQANPGELPPDIGKNVHMLFATGTLRLQSPASTRTVSPVQGIPQLQPATQKPRDNLVPQDALLADTQPTLDGSKELKDTLEPAPTSQTHPQSQPQTIVAKIPTAPMLNGNRTLSGSGSEETKIPTGEAQIRQTQEPLVADNTILSQPRPVTEIDKGDTASSGAEHAFTSELATAGSSQDVAANFRRSTLEPGPTLHKHVNTTTTERASSANMSENIDALIKEYQPNQEVKAQADRASSHDGRLSPISTSSASGHEVSTKNQAIHGNGASHQVPTNGVYQRTVSGTSSSLRIVKRPTHPYDHTPTIDINPKQ